MKIRIVKDKPMGFGLKFGMGASLLLLVCSLIWAQQPVQLQTVNGGGALALGHGTAATAIRVELPTDGTGIVGLAAGTNAIGSVTFGPVSTSGGAVSVKHLVESSSTYDAVKASAGNVYGIYVFNPNASPCYLMFYNNATPTIGTTANIQAIGVQGGVGVALPIGVFAQANFSTAITVANTTTDGGASVCTTGMSLDVWYQ